MGTMSNTNKHHFFENEHLTEEAMMLYAEAIQLDKVDELPSIFYEHLSECEECDEDITTLAMFIREKDYAELEAHPYFDRQESHLRLSDNPMDLDKLLEEIKANATPVPRYEKMIEQSLTFRSTASAALQLKVLRPKQEELFLNSIEFQFETSANLPILLQIENQNRRKVIPLVELAANERTYIISLGKLSPFETGLYYWKAAVKGMKPIMGKFYVYNS